MFSLRKNIAISQTGFIFDPDTGESFTVNPIGLQILGLLHEGLDIQNITQNLLDKYEVDSYTLEHNLNDFLLTLQQLNLTETPNEV